MKPFRLVIFCVVMTVILAVGWMIGSGIGNAITQSTPPPPHDAAAAGLAFLGVCVFNSVLLAMLIGATRSYTGNGRRTALMLYVFVVQFLLPQMETFFFAPEIGIGYDQATAILISGTIVAFATVALAISLYEKLAGSPVSSQPLRISIPNKNKRKFALSAVLLILVGYPFLYLTFGYFVAWQNEDLRVYYTSSTETKSYLQGFVDAYHDGVYAFQLLRGAIWIAATIPLTVMLNHRPVVQFLLIGVLSALLPTCLLFIPNPFMPWGIAMTHFVETSTSNFVWGLMMVWVIRSCVQRPTTKSNNQ